jgi:spore photoproduct lyase
MSLNAEAISGRLELGTPSIEARIQALRKLALPVAQGGGNYPIGVILAPIMPIPGWQEKYSLLLEQLRNNLDFPCDLTFELITHRFTPGSKNVLMEWYPNTSLEMDEAGRAKKTNKFGGLKYVYKPETMTTLRNFFQAEIKSSFPHASILYWT